MNRKTTVRNNIVKLFCQVNPIYEIKIIFQLRIHNYLKHTPRTIKKSVEKCKSMQHPFHSNKGVQTWVLDQEECGKPMAYPQGNILEKQLIQK